MSTSTILGALAFVLLVIAVLIVSAAIVAGLRERAYQRRREAEYAEAWVRAHRARQYRERIPARDTSPNRYLTDTDGAPE
jgi:ABC-type lipoprotein release transport system permease subunit